MAVQGYIYPGEMCALVGIDGASLHEWVCNVGSSPITVVDTRDADHQLAIVYFHTTFPTYGYVKTSDPLEGVCKHPQYYTTIPGWSDPCPVYVIRHDTTIYKKDGTPYTTITAGKRVALQPYATMDRGDTHVGWMSINFFDVGYGWADFGSDVNGFIDSKAATYGLSSNAVLDYQYN